jgi:hypothetical protein
VPAPHWSREQQSGAFSPGAGQLRWQLYNMDADSQERRQDDSFLSDMRLNSLSKERRLSWVGSTATVSTTGAIVVSSALSASLARVWAYVARVFQNDQHTNNKQRTNKYQTNKTGSDVASAANGNQLSLNFDLVACGTTSARHGGAPLRR